MPTIRLCTSRRFLGSLFYAAMMCLSAAATTTNVVVTVPAGEYFYPGTTVAVSADVTVTASKANFTATFDVTCTVNGTTVYSQTGYELHVMTASGTDSISFSVSESEAGAYSIVCASSGELSGGDSGSFSGTGDASFTVTNCTGSASTSGEPSNIGEGLEQTAYTLKATMNPANPSSQTKTVYGDGITGDVSANPTYDLDCDGDPNDNLAAQNPEIKATDQVQEADGSIIFNFQITNFQYTGTGCDACDSNPNGYYPVGSESYNSSPFLQAYCGAAN
jgi:hypothetical protein